MSMYMNASHKAMLVWQWDQKAIARMQLCSSKMLSNVTFSCAALVDLHAMPEPAVLSDVTQPSPPVSQLHSLMQVSAPMTLLCKDKTRVLPDVIDLTPWVSQPDSLLQDSAPMTLFGQRQRQKQRLANVHKGCSCLPCRQGKKKEHT